MVADLLRLAAEDARRAYPALLVRVDAPDGERRTRCRGSPEGLRMALANAVINAVRHGRAAPGLAARARRGRGGVVLTSTTTGSVSRATEREAVLGRFVRGSTAGGPGSGLGLALVAQQAARHGGGCGWRRPRAVACASVSPGSVRIELGDQRRSHASGTDRRRGSSRRSRR